jgi:hypothetical protein
MPFADQHLRNASAAIDKDQRRGVFRAAVRMTVVFFFFFLGSLI